MNLLIPLVVAIAVVVIYLLRTPPRPIIVPSSYLWEKLAKRARPLRERLRWLLSLLLAVAIASSMAWALAKSPRFGGGRGETALAIVIDNSGTMAAERSNGGTRLEEALGVARRAIRNNRGPILVADTAGQIGSFSYGDAERATDLLARISIDYSDGHRYPPLPEPPSRATSRTLYLTDGVGGPAPDRAESATVADDVVVHSVFEAAANVGITAFDTRRAPDGRLYLYIELVHAADRGNEVRLTVEEATASRLDRVLSLDANELWSGVIDVTGWASPLSASVELVTGTDSLAADNQVWKLITAEEPARILLLSDRPDGLVDLLRATAPGVVVQTLSTTQLYSQQEAPGFWEDFDILVSDRTAPSGQPPIATWWIAPPSAPYLPRIEGPVPVGNAVAEAVAPPSPVLGGDSLPGDVTTDLSRLDLGRYGIETLTIERVQLLDPASLNENGRRDVRILATAGDRPLIVAWRDRTPNILQTFDIPDREFAMSPVMPVLAADLIASLRRAESNTSPGPFFVDSEIDNVVTLAAPGEGNGSSTPAASFHNPPRRQATSEPGEPTPRTLSSTSFSRPGLYRILFRLRPGADSVEHRDVAINPTRRSLSQINRPTLAATPTSPVTLAVDTKRSIPWRSLVVVALVLGLVEWFTFNRKVTI